MLHHRRYAAALWGSCVLWLSACQVLSGLADLNSDSSAPATSVAGTSSGSSSGSGGGGVGGGLETFPCADPLVMGLPTRVDRLVITPDMKMLIWTSSSADPSIDSSIQGFTIAQEELIPLIPGPAKPRITGLAADDAYVYWLGDSELDPSVPGGSAWRIYGASHVDKHLILPLATEDAPTAALAATQSGIYWAVPGKGRLRAFEGGMTRMFVDQALDVVGAPTMLVPYASSLYWRHAASGGVDDVITFVDTPAPEVYTADVQSSNLVPTMGKGEFAIANDVVYWTEQAQPNGRIRFGAIMNHVLSEPDDLVSMTPPPTHIIAGKNNVFWAQGPNVGCSDVVMSTSRAKGGALVEHAKGGPCVSNFVQDTSYVYWGSGTTICRALH